MWELGEGAQGKKKKKQLARRKQRAEQRQNSARAGQQQNNEKAGGHDFNSLEIHIIARIMQESATGGHWRDLHLFSTSFGTHDFVFSDFSDLQL